MMDLFEMLLDFLSGFLLPMEFLDLLPPDGNVEFFWHFISKSFSQMSALTLEKQLFNNLISGNSNPGDDLARFARTSPPASAVLL